VTPADGFYLQGRCRVSGAGEVREMPEPIEAGSLTWLLLVYRLPAKPEALKAVIRRRLSAAGAVYLSHACAASGPAERAMRHLRAMITDSGGSAAVLRASALAGEPELAAALNAERDREYDDIIAGCGDAVRALEIMAAAGDFCYQKLWDKQAVLDKLTGRYRVLRERDLLGACQAGAAAAALARHQSVVDEYARGVYATDSAL
jgi:hypothetical protein